MHRLPHSAPFPSRTPALLSNSGSRDPVEAKAPTGTGSRLLATKPPRSGGAGYTTTPHSKAGSTPPGPWPACRHRPQRHPDPAHRRDKRGTDSSARRLELRIIWTNAHISALPLYCGAYVEAESGTTKVVFNQGTSVTGPCVLAHLRFVKSRKALSVLR